MFENLGFTLDLLHLPCIVRKHWCLCLGGGVHGPLFKKKASIDLAVKAAIAEAHYGSPMKV